MKQYGYVRISSRDQNPERQIRAMQEQQIPDADIYLDKMSGQDFSRPEYLRLMRILKKDDVLVVKSIDRLGRNYGEILEQWRKITKEIGADIQVLDMPLLNTKSSHSDLTGVFIADLVLQILAYVAETERTFIKQRQAEGIVEARQRGVQFGRRPMEHPPQYEKLKVLWQQGEVSARNAAKQLGITHRTFLRWVNKDMDG